MHCACYIYVQLFIYAVCGKIHLLIFHSCSYNQLMIVRYKIRPIISATSCSLKYSFQLSHKCHNFPAAPVIMYIDGFMG